MVLAALGASGLAKLAACRVADYGSDLFTYETTSVLRNRVTQNEADEALEILAGLEITYH
ncbi:MAG TPA: hypothetical protein VFU31_09030 [Candidatus Binatia bacterium]|nr:hypothetical protein [Candidatus Binatia bacterium]